MTAQSTPNTVRGWLLWLALAMVLWYAGTGVAFAQVTVNSVSIGAFTTVTAGPGEPIDINVNATVGTGWKWGSTRFSTTATISNCYKDPSFFNPGTFDQLHANVLAPVAPGTYALTVTVFETKFCNGNNFYST